MTAEDVQRLKRDAVLKEAGRAFSKRGFHNTSLDEVAKTLQVSKGTLYNYVKDKQEILWEFFRIATELSTRAFEIGEKTDGTGAEILRRVLTTYITLLMDELGACGALTEIDALRPKDRAEATKSRDAFQRRFVALIEAGMKDGSIRQIDDPRLAVYTFMGSINWLPRWFSPDGRLTGAEVAGAMTDMLLSGLVTPTSAPSEVSVSSGQTKLPTRRANKRETSGSTK